MSAQSNEFIVWLSRHVLPHEPALRHWLQGRAPLHKLGLTADDLVQEAYVRLTQLHSVEHIQNPKAYFFRTAHSILLQEIRKNRVVPIESVVSLDSLDVISHEPTPDQALESRQDMQTFSSAIRTMPKKCRTVFVLKKVHGYSQREIAEKLGISENTVESHLARGIRKLMDYYSGSGISPPNVSEGIGLGERTHEHKSKQRNHQ
ncbi:MAG: sigma-70 family RNA polymerase sigma factor [Hyphomonas sp.]